MISTQPEAVTPEDLTLALRRQIADVFDGSFPLIGFANDWNGDPTSKHHIIRTYAEFTESLWVEASGMRRPQMTSGLDRSRLVARFARSFSGPRRVADGLHVTSPLSAPLPGSRAAEALNRELYRWTLRRAGRGLGWDVDPLLWVYIPTVAPYLSRIARRGLVYHCVDRWWAFSDYDPVVMRKCHEQLCRDADVVFASSAELLDDCLAFTPHAHLIRHGVEWEHFSRAALEPQTRPEDIADIEGPILGFFGLIHEWVDQELICEIADAFPGATVVLIGKVQVEDERLRSRSNIRLLGQKPYAELPRYAAFFDVGLIPFVSNELTLAVNPIKLREYLSAGMPVVATALPEIALLADNPMLAVADTPAEHVAGIRRFLASGRDSERRREAAESMVTESWLGRCAEMARLVGARLDPSSSDRSPAAVPSPASR